MLKMLIRFDLFIIYFEHKNVLQKYLSARGNIAEREYWANYFRWELTRHSVAEELLLYPAFEQYLGSEGKKMADEDRADHQEVFYYHHTISNYSFLL